MSVAPVIAQDANRHPVRSALREAVNQRWYREFSPSAQRCWVEGVFYLPLPTACFFTAVRDPGVRGKLAEACQPGSSNPSSASHIRKAAKPPTAIGILLSCAKKNGVGRQEEVAQRKPFERVFSGLFRKQKGCGPFEIPGVPDLKRLLMGQSSTGFGGTLFLACKHLLVCKMTDDYAAKQQMWRHLSAARHFCSAKILAGRAVMGDGGPRRRERSPAQRNFQRKFALRRVGSTKFVVPLD